MKQEHSFEDEVGHLKRGQKYLFINYQRFEINKHVQIKFINKFQPKKKMHKRKELNKIKKEKLF